MYRIIRKTTWIVAAGFFILSAFALTPHGLANNDPSLAASTPTEPVQAVTSIAGPEQPAQPVRPAIERKTELSDWETKALSPSTSPFSRETKVIRVDFSSAGGDILPLDKNHGLIYGRNSKKA